MIGAMLSGFNRYIVECKYLTSAVGLDSRGRFNRYIVECKYSYYWSRLL